VNGTSTQRDRHPQVGVSRRCRKLNNYTFTIQIQTAAAVHYYNTSWPTLSPSVQQHPSTIILYYTSAYKKRVASTIRGQKPRARAFTVTRAIRAGVTGCSVYIILYNIIWVSGIRSKYILYIYTLHMPSRAYGDKNIMTIICVYCAENNIDLARPYYIMYLADVERNTQRQSRLLFRVVDDLMYAR